jgi:hypothetical protein
MTATQQRKDWPPTWPARVVKGNADRDEWKRAVSRNSAITPLSRLRAHSISGYWNVETAWTFVGTGRLAESISLDRRNVHRHIAELVEAGHIYRERAGHGRRMFTALTMPTGDAGDATTDNQTGDAGDATTKKSGDAGEDKVVTLVRQSGVTSVPLTPLTPREEVSTGGSGRASLPEGRSARPAPWPAVKLGPSWDNL